jgi:predicted ABC-type ATPase
MSIKRMRVFAGPNGSGKTTIFKGILKDSNINLGVYVNADEIEVVLNGSSPLDFGLFQIQVSNEQLRVAQNGHYVDPDVISRRYFRSLKNLKFAIKQTDRAYVFDNTGTSAKLVAEITNGINVIMNSAIETPSWVIDSLI